MSLDALDFFEQVPDMRPAYNVGCLFDVPVGRCYEGEYGQSILNGGVSNITGVCGRGNSYKSTLSHWLNLKVVDRYDTMFSLIYDTEFSLTPARIHQLGASMDNIAGLDLFKGRRAVLTSAKTLGEEYWAKVQEYGAAKLKLPKSQWVTTPFIVDGEKLRVIPPTSCEMDSMSQMAFGATEDIHSKNDVDGKEQNVEALRANLIKGRILTHMPNISDENNILFTVVAHMGDDLQLDPMAPPQKKLSTMKQKIKFKKVPENFTFLTNNLYYCSGAKPFLNGDKTPYFPKGPEDNAVMDQDLQIVTVQNLRAKSGPSGIPFDIIVSQTEGLLPSLTELNFLRNRKKVCGATYPMGYGISGNDRGYFLDLLPDVKLSRTTARRITNENYLARRALEITSEMCQMQLIWKQLEHKYMMSPADLFERLTDRGYDMDVLLNTRGYWVFEEDAANNEKEFLSTMDLLRMANDEYHPYWLTKEGFNLDSNVTHIQRKNAVNQADLKQAA